MIEQTFGSLFAGIGGIDLGLERAGWKCKWQVENDPYCVKILEKHWPNVKRYGDIKIVTELENVDLICGGFPCQPISVAGKRKGTKDERWLWPEFARIIRLVRPRYVLVENVPGILNVNQGRAMGEVLGDLAESGYDAEWNMLSASMFGGSHCRKRIFIVAYSNRNRIQRCGNSEVFSYDRQRWKNGEKTMPSWPEIWNLTRIRAGEGEPLISGVDHGSPHWLDRTRLLGNAVVPQIIEWICRRILELEGRNYP